VVDLVNWINGFFKKGATGSGSVAKSRLQVVLVHDRAGISPRTLEAFRKEMVAVISKYFEIDQSHLDIEVRHQDDYHALVVNTPIIRAKAAARS
jgi:cell division topological specificity factor